MIQNTNIVINPLKKLAFLSLVVFGTRAQSDTIKTITEYNDQLPKWGISWKAGAQSANGYYPSFYTGFAPRVQTPERIHIRLARGNQTRVSSILDEETVFDYLYDLKARNDFYQELIKNKYISVNPRKSDLTPHAEYFNSIVTSEEQSILSTINDYEVNKITKTELYAKSLQVLKSLNPERVFDLSIDLSKAFLNWRTLPAFSNKNLKPSRKDQASLVLVNKMLWGRVNLTRSLKEGEVSELKNLITNSSLLTDEAFVLSSFELFKSITGNKYNFNSLKNGKLTPALNCEGFTSCTLSYSELSAIYPTGSMVGTTRDLKGNRINKFATIGLSKFLDRRYHEVDHIRKESYYGYAPKLDYEGIGNGFHNPAVRLWPGSKTKKSLDIPTKHTTYWPVKRGGVSHGCSRLPLGHVWEMRHIMPVQNNLMKKVFYFGNNSTDFDIFDINGDGSPEIMGVKYYIEYNLKGSSGLDKREGEDLALNPQISNYFKKLYGKTGVYKELNGNLMMINPSASVQTINDKFSSRAKSKKVKSSYNFQGSYPLYEQTYEKDKAQFYTSFKINAFAADLQSDNRRSLGKKFVRLLGRVRGCSPFSNKNACGENSFLSDKSEVLRGL